MVIHLLTKQGEIKTKINHLPFMIVLHTVCITQLYKQNNSNSDVHWELAHTTYFFTCQQPSPQVIQKIGLIILQVEFILTTITIEKAVLMSHKWLYIEGFIQCKGQFLNKLDIIWNIFRSFSMNYMFVLHWYRMPPPPPLKIQLHILFIHATFNYLSVSRHHASGNGFKNNYTEIL